MDFAILDSGDSDIAVFQVRGFIFHPGESQLFLMSFAQLLAIFADSLLQLGDLCCSVYGCAFPLSVPCCLVMSLHVVSQLWGFPRIPAICSVADFLSCFPPFFLLLSCSHVTASCSFVLVAPSVCLCVCLFSLALAVR